MAKKKTNPVASTETEAPAPGQIAPSTAMVALFAANPNAAAIIDESKFKRRNMPQMVKPGDVPMGGIVSGLIVDIVDSPVSTVKGKLIWIRHENGTEFTFPCTGVIRNALAPGKDGADLDKALRAEIGNLIMAKRVPDKQSAKYKKNMFMFDVFTAKQ